ncbi:hypothetical protein SAMN05216174_103359 [Actinokineospora iranica]|uniref:Phosphotransferase enzyme family protein n=1 Tax=Actinokineospora iranica TaxID=1271860 RepID=A0A1G6NGV9_9PSEU|nr:hypothetical protein SAMN05216174_103359 [Actinokineospora iranica]
MEIAADPPETGDPDGTGDADHAARAEVLATVVAAESVLSKRFGARISLAEPEDLGGSERSIVLRVKVAASPFSLPRTLAVKRYVQPPGTSPRDSWVREAVSYQLFTALAAEDRMCPELFAHDSGTNLLVMEDLGRAPTLAEKLHGSDARAAEGALLSWARSLGKLHASTAGREADFDALLRRLSPPTSKDPLTVDGPAAMAALPGLLRAVYDVETPDDVVDSAQATLKLLDAVRHRAFSPSDSCPDNNLITNRGVRFLDFEGGCVRNMMFDAAYLTVPFPSCWCAYALPPGMTDAMLAAWRAEVRTMWPDLADDAVLLPKLLDAQIFWVWLTTWQFLTVPDVEQLGSGGSVARPHQADVLVERWAGLAKSARRAGAAAVADHADTVVAALTARFGSRSLSLYPAFD